MSFYEGIYFFFPKWSESSLFPEVQSTEGNKIPLTTEANKLYLPESNS